MTAAGQEAAAAVKRTLLYHRTAAAKFVTSSAAAAAHAERESTNLANRQQNIMQGITLDRKQGPKLRGSAAVAAADAAAKLSSGAKEAGQRARILREHAKLTAVLARIVHVAAAPLLGLAEGGDP